MQLLVRNVTEDADAWKSAFDAGAEARMQAGLTVLQIWRDADRTDTMWYLLEANDPDSARAWSNSASARLMAERGRITESAFHPVNTV